MKEKTNVKINKEKIVWKTILAVFITLLHIVPIYIAFVASVKKQTDFTSYWLFPKNPFFENYIIAFRDGGVLTGLKNTVIITIVSGLLIVLFGSAAAYPLARIKSNFNRVVIAFITSIMMVPALSLLVPLYTFMVKLQAVNHLWGIVLVHLAFQLPLSVFLYWNFIKTIPSTLDEAASIDGCNQYSLFYRIILPLLKPVTVTVIILTCVNVWNDYQFSLYFLQKPDIRVVTVVISSFFAMTGSNLNVAAAGAMMAVLPMIIVYLFLQKYFVQGMVDGAVKG